MSEPRYIEVIVSDHPKADRLRELAVLLAGSTGDTRPEFYDRLVAEIEKAKADAKTESATEKKIVVRVISWHADDRKMQQALYEANNFYDRCQKLKENPPSEKDPKKIKEAVTLISEVEVMRDDAIRELLGLVLAGKQSGEEIAEVLKTCNAQTFRDIYWAAQGIPPTPLESPLLSVIMPVADSKPTAT